MTTETILTDEQIEHGRHNTFSTNNPFCPCDSKTMRKAARWAEQAVLQSPEIRALRKDAEFYRTLRKMRWNDSPLCVVRNPKESVRLGSDCPSNERLDLMILSAMEQQT